MRQRYPDVGRVHVAAQAAKHELLEALAGPVGLPLLDTGLDHRQPLVPAVPLEGAIDLLYQDSDGSLVVVDYKTDQVAASRLTALLDHYRSQGEA